MPRCLAGQRLLWTRLVRVRLGRFEELTDLLTHLRRVLVAVHRGAVLGGRANDLLLLADDRQRAVRLARETTAVSHHARHGEPPWSSRLSRPGWARVNPLNPIGARQVMHA